MKDVQLMITILLGMIGLTIVNILGNFLIKDKLVMEKLHVKKQTVISCGNSQSIAGYAAIYSVNSNDQFHKDCFSPSIKSEMSHSNNSGEGNGCAHQPVVGALVGRSVNRKQYNACTRS